METPAPVNLSALQAILAKSKQVMKKVDSEKPIVSNGGETRGLSESARSQKSSPMYSEDDEKEMVFEQQAPTNKNLHEAIDYTEEQVRNSNLPPLIKEAMLKKHIPKTKFTMSKFSLDDVSSLIEKKPVAQPNRKVISETVQPSSDMITVSRAELQNMINEAVINYFKKSYNKAITEETIRKTLNVLIKEGKISGKNK